MKIFINILKRILAEDDPIGEDHILMDRIREESQRLSEVIGLGDNGVEIRPFYDSKTRSRCWIFEAWVPGCLESVETKRVGVKDFGEMIDRLKVASDSLREFYPISIKTPYLFSR